MDQLIHARSNFVVVDQEWLSFAVLRHAVNLIHEIPGLLLRQEKAIDRASDQGRGERSEAKSV